MGITRIQSANGNSWFELIPEHGGMVHRLAFNTATGPQEVLAADTDSELTLNPWFRGRMLFPFNDRIPGGEYIWKGKKYFFPVNDIEMGDAIHGFLYKQELQILKTSPGTILLEYTYNKYYEYYPFWFTLGLEYSITKTTFIIKAVLTNTGREEMPWSLGWHPYFRFPGRKTINTCTLHFKSSACVETDANLIPTGKLYSSGERGCDFSKSKEIGANELDNGFLSVAWPLVFSNGTASITLSASGSVFEHLQLFIPPGRASIAIEPVTALTNSFNMPEFGLKILNPGQSVSGEIKVTYKN